MFFAFTNFSKSFRGCIRIEKQIIRIKILREIYLRSMLNNQIVRAKYFMELKDRELKDK